MKRNDEFLKRLLATFKVEAQEHLETMSSILLELENPTAERRQELIETLFREAHSLKGAARAVDLAEIEAVCQPLENVLAQLKRREIILSAQLLDSLHQVVDGLGSLLSESTPVNRSRAAELVQQLERGQKVREQIDGEPALPPLPSPGPDMAMAMTTPTRRQPAPAETVRITATRLDSLLYQAEELVSVKLASANLAAELDTLGATVTAWKRQWAGTAREARTIRRTLEKHNSNRVQLKRLLEAVERNESFVRSLEDRLGQLTTMARQDHRSAEGMVDQLLADMKQALMLPFSSLLNGFPKLVRDLSQDLGKSVELVIRGAELEADRRILEELKAPLIHLLRNCIDHGLENDEGRIHNQKPPRGTIVIAISPKEGGKVEITVSDDGTGINVARVLASAEKLGIVSAEQAEKMGEQEALSLIFASGFSTSPAITDISGRGLGLAIVREKVEKLGGAIAVETRAGAGTTFRMVLPLTLTTFRGLLIRTQDRLFVLPNSHVERVIRTDRKAIKTVENRATIPVNGQTIALIRLGDVLELPGRSSTPAGPDTDYAQAVVLALAATRVAFMVDEVIHEQEVLVKDLGPQLPRVRNVAGAAVLGTGKIAPVLNVSDLMKSAVKGAAAKPVFAMQETAQQRKSILVAEDSITSRMLLKNILESAGYEVATAVDGAEALTMLRNRPFDLVVTDVEMPRMDGFELTQKIRADRQLAELPLVLVTTLGSREHRERGIEVGANAYVVKSSFDQSDLHEIIRRLL